MRGSRLGNLTAFVAVAEKRSFAKAASHLGITNSSVSDAIRSLEGQLGVRLLNRTTRSVALTDAGEHLRTHLTPLLEGVDRVIDTVNKFRDEPTGTIRLTVHPMAAVGCIGPMLARFSIEYPQISLNISVDVDRKDIISQHFDAGVYPRECIDQDMIAVPINGHFRLLTVASPSYLTRYTLPSTPDDLQQHNCITYSWDSERADAVWKFQNGRQQAALVVKGALTANDPALVLRAALDGLGVVQLPENLVASLVLEGRLVRVLEDWSPRGMDFCLFHSSRRHVPVRLRTLVEFLRKKWRAAPKAEACIPTDSTARTEGCKISNAPDHRQALVTKTTKRGSLEATISFRHWRRIE
jgi:DNA-binding transcriptional LysR family regulator